jgi:hypothetical protein
MGFSFEPKPKKQPSVSSGPGFTVDLPTVNWSAATQSAIAKHTGAQVGSGPGFTFNLPTVQDQMSTMVQHSESGVPAKRLPVGRWGKKR